MTDDDMIPRSDAERRFCDWFRKNYPGPDTIIHRPDWHSPKVFRAATVDMIPRSEALAMVAAAYEDAAAVTMVTDYSGTSLPEYRFNTAIRARTDADALAALEAVKEEARREERQDREGEDMALAQYAYQAGWASASAGIIHRDPRVILSQAREAMIRATDTQEGEG